MDKLVEEELKEMADAADSLTAAVGNAQNLKFDSISRSIFLWSDVDHETACQFAITLMTVDQTPGPIRVIMNSCGGHSEAGLAIYDVIKTAKNRVSIDAFGACQSIAAIILQAGRERRLSQNAEFMIHNGSVSMEGSENGPGMVTVGKQLCTTDRRMHRLLAKRSKLTEAQIREQCRTDFYLTAQQAVKLGFADKIIKESR